MTLERNASFRCHQANRQNTFPTRLQAVMGHASIAMTFDRYGHLFADHDNDREAMKRLQAAVVAA